MTQSSPALRGVAQASPATRSFAEPTRALSPLAGKVRCGRHQTCGPRTATRCTGGACIEAMPCAAWTSSGWSWATRTASIPRCPSPTSSAHSPRRELKASSTTSASRKSLRNFRVGAKGDPPRCRAKRTQHPRPIRHRRGTVPQRGDSLRPLPSPRRQRCGDTSAPVARVAG